MIKLFTERDGITAEGHIHGLDMLQKDQEIFHESTTHDPGHHS
jgi:hypothetical protein